MWASEAGYGLSFPTTLGDPPLSTSHAAITSCFCVEEPAIARPARHFIFRPVGCSDQFARAGIFRRAFGPFYYLATICPQGSPFISRFIIRNTARIHRHSG